MHLKNVGPIRHCDPPHTACFTLPFTRCRCCRTPPLSHAACTSMSTTTTTITVTTRDRGDRYGPIEWAQWFAGLSKVLMICIRSSWFYCHFIISCFIKIRYSLPFWCWLKLKFHGTIFRVVFSWYSCEDPRRRARHFCEDATRKTSYVEFKLYPGCICRPTSAAHYQTLWP